jgi:lysophospholipase L1-like esterase
MTPLTHYIALGDSRSIDDAIALFLRSLRLQHPEITFANLTADGATTDDVLRLQLPSVGPSDEPTVLTIAAGASDLLLPSRAARPPVRLVAGINERLTRIVDDVVERRPNAVVLLSTLSDSADGEKRESEWLASVNAHVRSLAATRPNVIPIEPGSKGGAARSDLWLEALSSADVDLRELSRK